MEVEKCPLIPSGTEGEVVEDDMNKSEGITRQVKLEAEGERKTITPRQPKFKVSSDCKNLRTIF